MCPGLGSFVVVVAKQITPGVFWGRVAEQVFCLTEDDALVGEMTGT